MKYGCIEIGVADFDYEMGKHPTGISIEPHPVYSRDLLHRAPEGWRVAQYAVGPVAGWDTLYYVDPDEITTEPKWIRGCSMMGQPHPRLLEHCPEKIKDVLVQTITPREMCELFDVTSVEWLKIDAEGMDIDIALAWMRTAPMPERITFDVTAITPMGQMDALDKILKQMGYECIDEFECNYTYARKC